MKRLYRSTFKQVQLSEETSEQMRRCLQAASSQKEVIPMKKRLWRIVPVAAVLAVALTCTAFAYGEQILAQVQMITGGMATVGTDEDGASFVSAEITGGDNLPVEVAGGRIYFVHGDTREDITDQCSEDSYFSYEETSEDGSRQVLIIGGTPENVGYVNFVWMPNDAFASTCEADDTLWVRQAYADYGVEWDDTTPDGEPTLPYEVRDGHIYFTLDGSDLDITGQCSEDSWYTYETTGEDGSRQITLVGGTPETVNYLEIEYSGGKSEAVTVSNPVGEKTPWMDMALAEYGLDGMLKE